MQGETDLNVLLKSMSPKLHEGDYVFCTINNLHSLDMNEVLFTFKEEEGTTIIIKKGIADKLGLAYTFVAAWITLTVHSSLSAVGLTAAFSKALTDHDISCNVVAAYYHDHIFVEKKDAAKAMDVLSTSWV